MPGTPDSARFGVALNRRAERLGAVRAARQAARLADAVRFAWPWIALDRDGDRLTLRARRLAALRAGDPLLRWLGGLVR